MCDLVVLVLRLEELVEQRNHVAVDVVGPEAASCPGLRVRGKEVRAGVDVFQVLHDDGGLVGAPCWAVAEGGNEAARIDVKERLRLLVGIYFDILVGYLFVLERDPYALHERALNR